MFLRLEYELNQIEETFRHPNMIIQSIQAIQSRKEESLKEILMFLLETESNVQSKRRFKGDK
jgi:hypothetical protein